MLFEIFIFLTEWSKTKLHAIIPNTDYFKQIILKFKAFLYNSNKKNMHNILLHGSNTLSARGGKYTFRGEKFFYRWYIQKPNIKMYNM